LLIFVLLIFYKERKSDCSFCRYFEKSNSFALLQIRTKRGITDLLFFKERFSKRLHNCSFAKNDKQRDGTFALFKRLIEQAIAQKLF